MPGAKRMRLTDVIGTRPETGQPFTVEDQILALVRQGAYPHVVAAAAGVSERQWQLWTMATRFAKFQARLRQAQAQARVKAEIRALADQPLVWLRNGPGRERPDAPGWSAIVKPAPQQATQVNILASPQWNALWGLMLQVLGSYPEARAALADALAAFEPGKLPKRTAVAAQAGGRSELAPASAHPAEIAPATAPTETPRVPETDLPREDRPDHDS